MISQHSRPNVRRALVLGAGGAAAMAWEVGVIGGLAEAGVEVREADVVVGTSAGSMVGAQITKGGSLQELLATYLNRQAPSPAAGPPPNLAGMWTAVQREKAAGGSEADVLRRIGRLAIEAPTPPAQERLAAIAKRLALQAWPRTTLRIAAVDVSTGERHVFDRASGVELVDAVAASCAVPLVWPPVAIGGRMYMDGGLYSTENADLADDCGRVLVLALRPGTPPLAVVPLGAAIAQLEQRGTTVDVVHPDEGSQAAFSRVGFNLLDPAVMADAAEAGRAQGERLGREPSIRRWSGGS